MKKQSKDSSESFKSIISKISDDLIESSENYKKKQNKYLSNYFLYKLKKWTVFLKREGTKSLKASFLLSYENEQIVCKICATSVLAKTIKNHSVICLKLTETKIEIKKNVDMINYEILTNLMKYRRSFNIQNMIIKYRNFFFKLKKHLLVNLI